MLLILLVLLAGIPILLGLSAPDIGQIGLLVTFLVFLLASIDLLISPSLKKLEVEREAGEIVSVGTTNPVRIWITNHGRSSQKVRVHDDPPQPCTIIDLPATLDVHAGETQYLNYHIEPHHRGKNQFGDVYLQAHSRLGLWTLHDVRKLGQPVQVYPDIKAVHGVELLARHNRLAEAGVRLSRLRGRGNEFDRLREYRREDEYRSIDWKATARHQDLIAREYVVEKNQNVLFLLDCGRSMCNEQDGVTHFDRALNAAILLSFVALRQGDTVGLMGFSNKVERWVKPLRGASAIQGLIRQVYDLKAVYEASDYSKMVEQLRFRHRKRSLVIVLTHALDEIHLDAIGKNMRKLQTPHLVLGAFLRNAELHERMASSPNSILEAYQIAAAADMVSTQSRQIAQLQKSGLLLLETLPEELSGQLINQYLEIKARHLL